MFTSTSTTSPSVHVIGETKVSYLNGWRIQVGPSYAKLGKTAIFINPPGPNFNMNDVSVWLNNDIIKDSNHPGKK